jgi:hypothetical protein
MTKRRPVASRLAPEFIYSASLDIKVNVNLVRDVMNAVRRARMHGTTTIDNPVIIQVLTVVHTRIRGLA